MNDHRHSTHVERNGKKRLTNKVSSELLAFEQLRLLATKIDQIAQHRTLRIIAITSSVASEGKTTTSINLATVMAKFYGKKTLLVEADFRRPMLSNLLKSNISHGLIEVLKGEVTPADARWQVIDKQLMILPLAKPEVDGIRFFSNPTMRARFQEATADFDYVIMDTPPVLPLADNSILAGLVDGFLFVVRAERTPRRLIASAVKCLPHDKLIGFILNGTETFGNAAYSQIYYTPSY